MGLSAVASSLAQCGVGWMGAAGQATMAEPQFGSFMSLAADRLGTAPHSPSHSAVPSPPVVIWSLGGICPTARGPLTNQGISWAALSGRKNSLSLEPPCFRLSPLLKAKPAHHLQGLNFAERFLGGGLAGKGVGRGLLWQRGALGCLGSTNLGSARHPNASHV